jgi:hypothetical protein
MLRVGGWRVGGWGEGGGYMVVGAKQGSVWCRRRWPLGHEKTASWAGKYSLRGSKASLQTVQCNTHAALATRKNTASSPRHPEKHSLLSTSPGKTQPPLHDTSPPPPPLWTRATPPSSHENPKKHKLGCSPRVFRLTTRCQNNAPIFDIRIDTRPPCVLTPTQTLNPRP